MSDRNADEPDGFYPLPLSEAAALNMFTLASRSNVLLSHEQPDRPASERLAASELMPHSCHIKFQLI